MNRVDRAGYGVLVAEVGVSREGLKIWGQNLGTGG